MPNWTPIPLDYVSWPNGTDVFVSATTTFEASFGKMTAARDKGRQAFFEDYVGRIAWHLGTNTIPVFIDFNGNRRRMDKGCVGHAIAAGVLAPPTNGPNGYVAEVTLKREEPR